MFGRGRLDHLALHAESIEAFETIRDRLVERGASEGFVTDFGPVLSLFYRDPDGLESEVCVLNPDATPGTGALLSVLYAGTFRGPRNTWVGPQQRV